MAFNKSVKVLLQGQAKVELNLIKNRNDKLNSILLEALNRLIQILQSNPQYGSPIKKQLIPQDFKLLHIQNLYRLRLPNYWRLLYTIASTPGNIYVIILYIADHKRYNKLMGYI